MDEAKRMDPSTKFVRSLDGDYFLLREVAQMLGISSQALRKTVPMKDIEAPSFWVMFGKLKIYLYTREDIDEIRKYLADRTEVFAAGEGPVTKVGRPRKYNDQQKREKQREYARSYYWRTQLAKGVEDNDDERVTRAKAKLYELDQSNKRLDEEVNQKNANIEPEVVTNDQNSENFAVKPVTFNEGTTVEPAVSG